MRRSIERVFDRLTPVARVQVAIWASTPILMLVFIGHDLALRRADVRAAVRADVLLALQAFLLACIAVNAVTAVRLWPRRTLSDRVPGATLLVCLSIGLAYTAIVVLVGTFTAPTGMVMLGVLAIGLLLFELRPMAIAYLTCTLLMVGYDLGVVTGLWPYAPALTERVYAGAEPVWALAWWRNAVLVLATAVLVPLSMLLFGQLDRMHARLTRLSLTDGLTGLANRRRFMDVVQAEVARRGRFGQRLCVALLDVDHFKQVNDAHGHLVGDAVLSQLASVLMASVRAPSDVPCRLGGEEFALILPDTGEADALAACERLREQVAARVFGDGAVGLHITVSIGLVAVGDDTVEGLLGRADEALYRAKSMGRNRVCVAPAQEPSP